MKVIIVGGAKVGTYLAQLLSQEGHQVKVIEIRAEEVERLRRELPADGVIQGSGTDPNVLESSGIHNADVVAAVTGADEVNLVVTTLARFEFNVPRTIGRINNPKNAWLFTPLMGVDVAVNQADLMARLIAEEMSLGDMLTLVKLRKGQFSLVEIKIDPTSPVIGKPVNEITWPSQSVLVTVLRKGELLIPHGELRLQAVDEVLVVVHADQVADLYALLGPAPKDM
ncbi:MAG TPA: NAD-binding protein [Anaerolineae bacterium]|nr:NAD-binding protein [Anaerolineae bacterium]HQH38495.1 NAD-binding protein [Anaerolineae bacterium]